MNTTKEAKKVNIGKVTDYPVKVGKEVIIGEHHIAIFRLSNGKMRAVENRCPHKNGPLSQGIVSGEHVFCPLHDWKIDLDSGEVQKPDDGCVKTYQVTVEAEDVFITI
ncbi:nitrite reductase small subunit NirD [Alkalihalobacterium bogoriense]|uniref:nitrite reductase small subunit NirD n=1 Tax=Alkalihalobacterium bogoriense TaxID=246272 RepID=UPI00047B9801|nr:nitrite reductase small subunit NirD [Alkalihalobacterium bogoriense]